MQSINKEQILKGIERANPWWQDTKYAFPDYPKRVHFDRLYDLTIQKNPVRALVLLGPRRVGKTILLYHLIEQLINAGKNPKKIMYVSLDNPIFRFNYLDELVRWGMAWSGSSIDDAIVFFDEIQYIDNWEQQLKVLVDTHKSTKFIVTGSAAAALNKKSKESGAGRFSTYILPALSFYEFIQIKGEIENVTPQSIDLNKLNALYLEYLNSGGFPESISSEDIRNQPEVYIGQDILDKVLGRDLPSIYGINNPNEMQKLFASLAYNTSSEISPEKISQQAGVSKTDIHRYIDFFEAAFLIKVIEKTDHTLKKFLRKTHFKIVLTNPSLRSAIFGKLMSDDAALEALAETAIFSQLIGPEGTYLPYKYARWNHGGKKGEVDLVHVNKKNEVIAALEIKWTDRYANGDKPSSLISFCRENKLTNAVMSSKSVHSETCHGGITIQHYPTAVLCYAIGMTGGILGSLVHAINKYSNVVQENKGPAPTASKEVARELAKSVFAMKYLSGDLIVIVTKAAPFVASCLVPEKMQK